MAFEHPGGASLDYQVCRYGKSRLLVRGPKVRLAPPYTAFFGGTETYGRFVAQPFPQRVGRRLGRTCVNLGCINAGLDAFAEDRALLAIAAGAETCVVQVLGAANLSNDFYTVHPRRNDRFIAATPALTSLYPEVDFTRFSFTRHLLTELEQHCGARFSQVVDTLKARWRLQMLRLLSEAGPRSVLLWVALRPPPARAHTILGAQDPLFVDREMIAELAPRSAEVVHVIPSKVARASGTAGMVFTEFEEHIAEQTINDAIHAEIAIALGPVLARAQQAA